MTPIRDAALQAFDASLSILPARGDGSKTPNLTEWKSFQKERPTIEQLSDWFGTNGHDRQKGLIVVCGEASGGLEVIDFDDFETWRRFVERADQVGLAGLVDDLVLGCSVETPRPGVHLYFRSKAAEGNQKLAQREDVDDQGEVRIKTLIETRGNGGYVITPPSGDGVHPSGGSYRFMRGGFDTIREISPKDREELLRLCRTFHELKESEPEPKPDPIPDSGNSRWNVTPFDDFASRTTWAEILEPHGWTHVFDKGSIGYWRRPGKDRGWSATVNALGTDRLRVFTTSTLFNPESYSKAGAYAALNHGGDFKGAYRELMERGYGVKNSGDCGDIGDWKPLRIRELPDVSDFPLDVLPQSLRHLCETIAREIGTPIDFPAVDVLSLAAGVIGNSVALCLKPGYWARSSLYVAKVGTASDGKSPSLLTLLAPIQEIDREHAQEFHQELKAWNARQKSKGKGEDTGGDPPPKLRRILVDDATAEQLVEIHADNPRGVTYAKDELRELFEGLNQYKGGRGADRAVFLKAWSGAAIIRDRRTNAFKVPVRVDRPCINITGGIVPDMLGAIAADGGPQDGMVERFLFCWPTAVPVAEWQESGVPDETLEPWQRIVRSLHLRPLQSKDDFGCIAHAAGYTDNAKKAWKDRFDAMRARMRGEEIQPELVPTVKKLEAYAGRFALVLACIWQADDMRARPEEIPVVDEPHVRNAWRLVDYFLSHAMKVRGHRLNGASRCRHPASLRSALQWIQGRSEFNRRELQQARKWDRETLDDVLASMIEVNAIKLIPTPPRTGPGLPPSPLYRVHPEIANPIPGIPRIPRNIAAL